MATKKEVVKKEQSQMTLFSDDRPDYITNSERGSEEVNLDDIVLPRIDVLQALSPQIKRNDPKYIEGAEQGMVFNTVTEQIYGSEILFVPVYFKKEWLVWKKRSEGGGFRGAYPSKSDAEMFIRDQDDASSLEAMDTAQHFVIVVHEDGSTEQAVVSMSRSKMKVSRQLNSMIRMAGGDRFSRAYKLKSVEDSSDKGDFWNFKVSQLGYVSEELFQQAEQMYDAVKSGERSVDYSDVIEGDSSSADDEY